MNGEQDLPACRMRERGDDGVERRELRFRVQRGACQTCSISQMRRSSRIGPIGSQIAMTSGV